jgi:hypothetical protein
MPIGKNGHEESKSFAELRIVLARSELVELDVSPVHVMEKVAVPRPFEFPWPPLAVSRADRFANVAMAAELPITNDVLGLVHPDGGFFGFSNAQKRQLTLFSNAITRVTCPSLDCITWSLWLMSRVEFQLLPVVRRTISSVAVGRAVVEPPVKPALGLIARTITVRAALFSHEIMSSKLLAMPVCLITYQECAEPAELPTRLVSAVHRSTPSPAVPAVVESHE